MAAATAMSGEEDHGVWTENFGETLPAPAAVSAASVAPGVVDQPAAAHATSITAAEPMGFSEPVQPTQRAPTRQTAASERDIALAALEPVSQRKDRSRIGGQLDRYRWADSGGGDSLLLVAIDRARRSPGPNVHVTADRESNDQHTGEDLHSLADEHLDLALSVWR